MHLSNPLKISPGPIFIHLAWGSLPLIFLFGLCSCGKSRPASDTQYNSTYPVQTGGTLIDAMLAEPSGLIAMTAGESAASAIASNIFNSLLKYDKNLELTGELAESWKISPDQKTITFKLKPNLKWADGAALTSADALFTWKLVTDEKTRTPYGSDYKLVISAEALTRRLS